VEGGLTEKLLIGIVLVAFVAAVGARAFYNDGRLSHVTLINRSAETIDSARLRQGDREATVGQIEPSQMRSADFIAHTGSLSLTVTFSSGRILSATDVGYIAPATSVTVFFNVTDDKVALLEMVARNPSNYSKR